jgi:hypothetical protein
MYVHLGNDVVVPFQDLIAIVGIENQVTEEAQDIINMAEIERRLTVVGNNKNKSLVICAEQVYTSPISAFTLSKRAGRLNWEERNDD